MKRYFQMQITAQLNTGRTTVDLSVNCRNCQKNYMSWAIILVSFETVTKYYLPQTHAIILVSFETVTKHYLPQMHGK